MLSGASCILLILTKVKVSSTFTTWMIRRDDSLLYFMQTNRSTVHDLFSKLGAKVCCVGRTEQVGFQWWRKQEREKRTFTGGGEVERCEGAS